MRFSKPELQTFSKHIMNVYFTRTRLAPIDSIFVKIPACEWTLFNMAYDWLVAVLRASQRPL